MEQLAIVSELRRSSSDAVSEHETQTLAVIENVAVRAQSPSKPPAAVLFESRPSEVALAFDSERRTIDSYSLTVDGIQVIPIERAAAALTKVRFANLIDNSDFSNTEYTPWIVTREGGTIRRLRINFDVNSTLEGAGTAYAWVKPQDGQLRIEYAPSDRKPRHFGIEVRSVYCFSGYFATHRCAGKLWLGFHDAEGRLLTEFEETIPPEIPGGKYISDYARSFVFGSAPEEATTATLALLVERLPSAVDGCLFATRLWFGRSDLGIAPEWAPALRDELLRSNPVTGSIPHFKLPLPLSCYDGSSHSVRVVDRETGFDVEGSPLEFLAPALITGRIAEISGDRVVAVVVVTADLDPSPVIELQIDHELVGQTAISGATGESRIEFAIPPRLCDGRPHLFTAAVSTTGQLLAHYPAVSPCMLTPLDALQTYAGLPIDASFAPAARTRYQALLDHIGSPGGARADLRLLHDNLLRGPAKRARYIPLAFVQHEQPRVSVVVPVHNKFEMTYFCLSALLVAWNGTNFEVIIVDDGSDDETGEIENIVSGIVLVRNNKAQGFVRACNRGAESARGEYIVFLNNDTEPTSRWLDELLYAFERFERVGLAGAKLLYPDGVLQEAGGIVWANGNPWNYGRGGNAVAPEYSYTRQADYLSGAAVMIPRKVWREVGGFSDEFAPAYFEDTDLAFKVRAKGLKVVFVPQSVVYHYEGVSSGTSVTSGMKRFQEVNRPIFKRKWSNAYAENGQEGMNVDIAKDRGPRFRALMLDFEVPRMGFDAGSYAAIQEIRMLQALGFKVSFLPTNYAYMGRHTKNLQRMGVETLYAPFVNSVEGFLGERGSEFDLVYITRYQVAAQWLPAIRRHAKRAKVALNLADLHFLRELRAAVVADDEARVLAAIGVRDAELAVLRGVDLALSYSAVEEAVILSHNLRSTKMGRLPWVAEIVPSRAAFGERSNIAFLGGFRHPPNAEAVDFFVHSVMPTLSAAVPGVQFEVYGTALSDENRRRWTRDHVIVKGQVDSLEEIFGHARVFVAPLASGAGVKGKVFDSLAHGVPAVLSPFAAEGIGVRDGADVLIANSPEDWVKQIVRLYGDEKLWKQMSAAGQHAIETAHSLERGVETMRASLEKVGFFCQPNGCYLVANGCFP